MANENLGVVVTSDGLNVVLRLFIRKEWWAERLFPSLTFIWVMFLFTLRALKAMNSDAPAKG